MQTFLASEKIALSDLTDPVWQGNGGREWVDEGATDGGKMRRDVLIDSMFLVNYF